MKNIAESSGATSEESAGPSISGAEAEISWEGFVILGEISMHIAGAESSATANEVSARPSFLARQPRFHGRGL